MKSDSNHLLLWLGFEEIQSEIGVFTEYLDTMEGFLENKRQEYDQHNQSTEQIMEEINAGRLTVPPGTIIDEDVAWYKIEWLRAFSRILHQSLFLSEYALLESTLDYVCEFLGRDNLQTFSEFRDSQKKEKRKLDGIERAKKYLMEVLKIDFIFDQSTEWNRIKDDRSLRNCIAHSGGRITRCKEKRVSAFIKQEESKGRLKLLGKEVLEVRKEFCEEVISTIAHFFTALQSAALATQQNM